MLKDKLSLARIAGIAMRGLKARIKTLIIGALLIFMLLPCPVYAVTQEASTLPLAINIVISPAESTIFVGQSQAYAAMATAADNTTFDVTTLTTFDIDDKAGGTWLDNVYTSEVTGEWMVTGTYEGLTDNATLTVKPWGTTPMSKFEIDYAKLEFKKKPGNDSVYVLGELKLDLVKGNGVEISELVTVTVGPVSETVTMVERGRKGEVWQYWRPRGYQGIIKEITINWKSGKFDISIDKADLRGVTNPVTISLQIGDDIGEETMLMKEKKNYWEYEARRQWRWWEWWRWP